MNHKQECYSGTEPWNNCFCEPEKKERYTCKCGKFYGTKQGLLTHQRMNKNHEKS